MEMNKKVKAVANNRNLPKQFQNLMLRNLQEVNLKASKLNLSGIEANDVDITFKFFNPNLKLLEYQEAKKEETLGDKIYLFIIEQAITVLFQIIIMNFPQITFLFFSLVLAV
jgi:hypothetical protein